jgi:hypothetical protein
LKKTPERNTLISLLLKLTGLVQRFLKFDSGHDKVLTTVDCHRYCGQDVEVD